MPATENAAIRPHLRESFAAAVRRAPVLASGFLGLALAQGAFATTPGEEAINKALVENARADAAALMPLARTGYSEDLAALGRNLTGYLHRNGIALTTDKVVVVDPQQTAVGRALGLADIDSVRLQIGPEDSRRIGLEKADSMLENMGDTFVSPTGVMVSVHNPMAIANDIGTSAIPCLLVPENEHESPFAVPGLSLDETRDFFNTHESWHCLDTVYFRGDYDETELTKTIDEKDPRTLFDTDLKLALTSLTQRKEAFADVAALGEMIRAGGRRGLIGAVVDMREDAKSDFTHYSVPVLRALDRHIGQVGIDAFKKMDERAARTLYYTLADTYGLNATRLKAAAEISYGATSAPRTPDPLAETYARFLPGSKLNVAGTSAAARPVFSSGQMADTAGAEEMYTRLQGENLVEKLADRAFAQGGKVTPATLTRAYGEMQESFRQELKSKTAPEEQAYAVEKMRLLQAVFMRNLTRMDYAGENGKRGVTLTQKDAAAAGPRPLTTS
jgi:hypothetical protein